MGDHLGAEMLIIKRTNIRKFYTRKRTRRDTRKRTRRDTRKRTQKY